MSFNAGICSFTINWNLGTIICHHINFELVTLYGSVAHHLHNENEKRYKRMNISLESGDSICFQNFYAGSRGAFGKCVLARTSVAPCTLYLHTHKRRMQRKSQLCVCKMFCCTTLTVYWLQYFSRVECFFFSVRQMVLRFASTQAMPYAQRKGAVELCTEKIVFKL